MSATVETAAERPTLVARSPAPTTSAKVLRALVWFLLGALVVRTIGAGIGGWAAGRLDFLSTILIGLVLPVWLLVYLPTWLAWRVLRPLGLRRGVKVLLWLSPLPSARDLASIEAYLEVLAGRPLPRTAQGTADAWTALALALAAEQQGDRGRADRILETLTHLPEGSRVPLLARSYGIEALAFTTFVKGDVARSWRYARLGCGRLVRLLSSLAACERGELVRPVELLAQWALAPKRRATLPFVRKALARLRTPARPIPPPASTKNVPREGAVIRDPRQGHLLLLDAAARGEPIELQEVLSLADAWAAELDDAALAHLQARALELDARNGGEVAAAIRAVVLDELTLLAAAADGIAPSPVVELASASAPGPTLGEETIRRLRERLYQDVAEALRRLTGLDDAATIDALDAWERWLVLRAALDRLALRAGEAAVTVLWHSDLRNAVWTFTAAFFDKQRGHSAWAAHMMFAWLAERAECANDVPATFINRENARMAQQAASW
jgi:hypothetical protein